MIENSEKLERENKILTAEDGGQFSLTRVWSAGNAEKPPILYLSGSFTGRKFWLADKDIGLAAYLARQGYPGWIAERRGIGESPKPEKNGARPGIQQHIQHDLPMVQREIEATHHQPAFLIGHSYGGVMGTRAVAEYLDQSRIAGLVLFATQFDVGKKWMVPPLAWIPMAIASLRGDFPGPWSGLGPESEPAAALIDSMSWTPKARRTPAMTRPMQDIKVPVLAVTSDGDDVDPAVGCQLFIDRFASEDKTFLRLGKAQGSLEDYNHPGMVISKNAQKEVWPTVLDWLDTRSGS